MSALGENVNLQTVDTDLVQLKINDLPDPAELAEASAAIEAAVDTGEAVAVPAEDAQSPAETGAGEEPEADVQEPAGAGASDEPEADAETVE